MENCKSAFGSEYDEKTMICAAAKGKGVIKLKSFNWYLNDTIFLG